MFYASRDDSGYFGKPLEKNTFCDKCLLETHLSQKITMSQNPFLAFESTFCYQVVGGGLRPVLWPPTPGFTFCWPLRKYFFEMSNSFSALCD